MEKKEVRVKCRGCGTAFKLRIPVTNKPVSFKCRKCGKVLKLKITTAPKKEALVPRPPTAITAPPPGFERTQLPEEGAYQDSPAPAGQAIETPSSPEAFTFDGFLDESSPAGEEKRRWVILIDNRIKGPFSDGEIRSMIRRREITPKTSMRMGERPWIEAGGVAIFRPLFTRGPEPARAGSEAWTDLAEQGRPTNGNDVEAQGPRFFEEVPAIVPYPLGGGNLQPLVVFVGIAFVLSAVICLDFTVGLAVNLIGWTILYGYLAKLMARSIESPTDPPPDWDFAEAGEMVFQGAKVLAVLVWFSLLPVGLCLLLMIMFFLNSVNMLGYLFMILTVVVFAASLVVIPAGLVVLGTTERLGAALNPAGAIGIIKKGGRPYLMLVGFSLAAGMACMLVSVLSVFLVEIPVAGFLLAGLIMALVLSYGHFVWFHVVGRFSGQNRNLISQTVPNG